jgi:hypothetical protein
MNDEVFGVQPRFNVPAERLCADTDDFTDNLWPFVLGRFPFSAVMFR